MAKESDKKVKVSRTEERRRERETEQRRKALIYGGAIIGVIALVVLAAFLFNSAPAEAPIPTDAIARYEGIFASRSQRGYASLGSTDAPVRVSAYISLSNSESRKFHAEVFPVLLERIKAGDITFSYVLYDRIGEVSNFGGATRAGWCATEQNKLWGFVDSAYSWFDTYGNDAYSSNRLNSGAANLGLDMGRFGDCMRSNRPADLSTRALEDAGGRDADIQPPAVFVNDVEVEVTDGDQLLSVNEAINQALALRTGGATAEPTSDGAATLEPTTEPILAVTTQPTEEATLEPTLEATLAPTTRPTLRPTTEPTAKPSATPDN